MTVPRSNASHDQNHIPTLMGVSTTDGTTPVPVEVDPTTGQLQVSGGSGGGATVGLFTTAYDEIDGSYPTTTTEVYVSKLAGVVQQTVTVTYTDTTKDFISSAVRT